MLDGLIITCDNVTRNRNQIMKLISKFIVNWLNLIQYLEQELPNSCMLVFLSQLDQISLRLQVLYEWKIQNSYFRLSTLIKSTNMKTWSKMVALDSPTFTWRDLTNNQNPLMKWIKIFTLTFLNLMQDLAQQPLNSCLLVFRSRLDRIS